jgi:hypothetical protein
MVIDIEVSEVSHFINNSGEGTKTDSVVAILMYQNLVLIMVKEQRLKQCCSHCYLSEFSVSVFCSWHFTSGLSLNYRLHEMKPSNIQFQN